VQTLYELLGALPEDDADSLRTAFRKAAKAHHPDNNPGDPDAPQRFRRIVRAHAILGDERQRATYDSLLTEAHEQRALDSRRELIAEARHLVPNPVSSVMIAFVSIGAFLLLERALTIPIAPKQAREVSARAPVMTAATPAPASGTVGLADDHDKPDKILSAKEPDIPSAAEEITAPVAVAAVDNKDTIPTISEPAVKDARYYRERGDLAYRSGDFLLALTDFDLAINLDPNSSDAYINRAIVFRRMGDLKHAFADLNQAKHIDESKPQ
jgi:curved DNA-binding protein CbpA